MHNPLERRASNERRTLMQAPQFPIITRHGVCVRNDRRSQPDRRISKIEVGENFVEDDTFDLLFSRYKKNRLSA